MNITLLIIIPLNSPSPAFAALSSEAVLELVVMATTSIIIIITALEIQPVQPSLV